MNNRVIAITGFMASGKTTVGRELAKRLDCAFVDLDEEIVKREQRAISEIINADGEVCFRGMESAVLREILAAQKSCVVALGGGTWTIEENRATLQAAGYFVAFLDAPFELCWRRIEKSSELRPLAQSRDLAECLYSERQDAYRLANIRVEILDDMSPAECAETIASRRVQSDQLASNTD